MGIDVKEVDYAVAPQPLESGVETNAGGVGCVVGDDDEG